MIHFVFKTFYNYAQAFISAKKYVAKQIFGWIYPETNLLKGNSPTLTPNATAVGKKIHNPLTKAQWKLREKHLSLKYGQLLEQKLC